MGYGGTAVSARTRDIFSLACPRPAASTAYSRQAKRKGEFLRALPIAGVAVAGPDALASALRALSEADLLRLKTIAQLRVRELPGVQWTDLLHEAVLRALEGTRRWPRHVPLVVFLAGVMRSLADEHWRQHRVRAALFVVAAPEAATVDPERELIARESLLAVDRLFRDDAEALQLILGLANGWSAEEIQRAYAMDATRYATIRKRIRRRLLGAFTDGAWQ